MNTKGLNTNHSAVRRIMQEMRELRESPSSEYTADPLEDNVFEWHFSIRGPRESVFEQGLYHGRILLPADYPFKPPDIILLTPNGRFEVNKKICLSISGFHPETWQPSWSIRMVLVALVAFFPTDPQGAIGSLEYSDETRKRLALKSREWRCNVCGASAEDVLPDRTDLTESDKEIQLKASQIQFGASKEVSEDLKVPEPVEQKVEEKLGDFDTEVEQETRSRLDVLTLALFMGIIAILAKKAVSALSDFA